MFPACCYRSEVNLKTRVALAVAMMPRGEVCASIIVNALALGVEGPAMTIAVFCLACNMMMVSFFIFIVKQLTHDQLVPAPESPNTKGAEVAGETTSTVCPDASPVVASEP